MNFDDINYLKKIVNGLVKRRSEDRYTYDGMKSFIAQLIEKNARKKVIKRMKEKNARAGKTSIQPTISIINLREKNAYICVHASKQVDK